jgi:hypothetical protein
MFGFFKKKDFYETATEICIEYKNHLAMGKKPRECLVWAMSIAMKKHPDLKYMSVETYCASIFKDDFLNMSEDNKEAEKFVCKAIVNIISSYLHTECSPMAYVMDFTDDNPARKLENTVRSHIMSR